MKNVLKRANVIAFNYNKNKPTRMKELYLDDETRVIFLDAQLSGAIGYRVSKFGFRKFDVTDELDAVVVYHRLELIDKKNDVYDIPASDKKDIARFLGHVPDLMKVLRSDEPIVNPYPKSLIYVPPSANREILMGTMLSHKFVFESKKYLRNEFDYNSLEDYFE